MNVYFKNKKTGDIVRYFGPIQHVSDDNAEREGWNYCPIYEWCVQLYNHDKGDVFVTSLLEFINTYEPADKAVTDVINAFDSILNKENEGNKEDICALHSGEPETDCGTTPQGV